MVFNVNKESSVKTSFKRGLGSLVVAGVMASTIAAASPAMAASVGSASVQSSVAGQVNIPSAVNKVSKVGSTTTGLNVRKGTTASTAKLGTLTKGAKVTITGQDSKTKWFQITYKGKPGFVSNKYVTLTPAPKPPVVKPVPKPPVVKPPVVKPPVVKPPVVKPAPKPPVVKPAVAKVKTAYAEKHAGLTYAVIDGGVDWSKKVGKMMYLDGDFYTRGYSKSISEWPTGGKAASMSKIAAKRNMILVIPKIPTSSPGMGYTWWVDSSTNAPKLKSLDAHMDKRIGSTKSDTWYMGYSGGSEYITYELAKRGQGAYGNGGAILLAGGGSPKTMTAPPAEFKKNFDMHWIVGSLDGTGQSSNAQTWSAFEASKKGQDFYKSKGFKTSRTVLEGQNHHSYDIASVMEIGLKAGGL